jgi:hypothetical protein
MRLCCNYKVATFSFLIELKTAGVWGWGVHKEDQDHPLITRVFKLKEGSS